MMSGRSSILSTKGVTVTKDSNDNEEPTQGDELRRLKTSRALRHPRSATTGTLKYAAYHFSKILAGFLNELERD